MDDSIQTDPAQRLLGKLRSLALGLDAEERVLFAALIGPGVAELNTDDDVTGFAAGDEATLRWEPGSLRAQLSDAIADSEWQIVEPR